jgi:DNA-binding transcriptional ArsR family regulator
MRPEWAEDEDAECLSVVPVHRRERVLALSPQSAELHNGNLSIGNVTLYVSMASESMGTQDMKTIERPPEVRQEARRILEAISTPERYAVMLTLSHHKQGLSFSQLARIFTTNHNTLNRHLKTLTHATLVWNFYERREGKDHSFYKLSTLGERVLDSLKPELEVAGRESPIHHHSNIPVSA